MGNYSDYFILVFNCYFCGFFIAASGYA